MTTANPIYSTKTAFRLVTSQTGDLPYDDVDSLIWSQVNSLGKAGTLYTTQASTGLANNGYGVIDSGTKSADTDGDGMPDYWELAMGTNSAKDDAMTLGSDGYAYIEKYINWLGDCHATALKNGSADIAIRGFQCEKRDGHGQRLYGAFHAGIGFHRPRIVLLHGQRNGRHGIHRLRFRACGTK